ncbi:MAG: DUF4339 domain-containing protein [Lachnospiraceae bacterium]|nr:DUF4339 domain-containing protein [Lachnospiraceae bacterium]
MALFGKSAAGGFMDEIRCDEPSYLIWKWHPYKSKQGYNKRENAIRWGSSLRVKDGEVAVFVYNNEDGSYQDIIEGPFDKKIQTENLPVIASIIGLAYQGGTPFQAEVYFINLAKVIQIPFAVPYFDLYDPRFLDIGVPTSVHGRITFNIADYKEFIKLHRLYNFSLTDFQTQVRDATARYVKGIVTNVPEEHSIPVVQIERKIPLINEYVEDKVKKRLEKDFGVNVSAVDINSIEIDKDSEGYEKLRSVTLDIVTETTKKQAEINIKNMQDMQKINAENIEETMRIQREEAQYAQHKQTQTSNLAAMQLEKQAEVGIAGAEALGQMGANGAMEMSGGGGMNPAGMMTGMAMGGAIGQNMANMMNNMSQVLNNQQGMTQNPQDITPPPIPALVYQVAINGQASEPIGMSGLFQMVNEGSLTKDSLVWKQGMKEWAKAGDIQELQTLFEKSTLSNEAPPIPTDI